MSLQTSYPNPYSTTPLTNAYVWIAQLNIDFAAGVGTMLLFVNVSSDDAHAGLPPIATQLVRLGSDGLPSLSEFLADNATAFTAIRSALYDSLLTLPAFADATEVP